MSSSAAKVLEIHFQDPNPQKWCHPLKEDVFAAFFAKHSPPVYRPASLFSPLLFGKFFDPSDAFPLWEFEAEVLLPPPSAQRSVDWYQTEADYVLRAEIPGNSSVEVCVENGKILEVSGQWKKESRKKEWRSSHWWEHGFVRRLELPLHTDWRKTEAHFKNISDLVLEIRIPKLPPHHSDTPP